MIQTHFADVGDIQLHYAIAGEGPALVLLHGWPQSWRAWKKVIPLLAPNYTVIAPDLRGLGLSSLAQDGYAKRKVAEDVVRLVRDVLGHRVFYLAGHDWGGPVAFSLAMDHPDLVKKLAILDVAIPGDGSPNISQGGQRWHHAFHQTADLPEELTRGREDIYLGWFYRNYGHAPDVLDEAEIADHVALYSRPGRMSAGFGYYRALAQDITDNRERLERRGKLAMPVLALGGDSSWGRRTEVLESVSRVATSVIGGVISRAGHWIPEEQPEEVASQFTRFFI
jgi:pimeloyl-ACP methyl ester carboxylesterase